MFDKQQSKQIIMKLSKILIKKRQENNNTILSISKSYALSGGQLLFMMIRVIVKMNALVVKSVKTILSYLPFILRT